MFESRGHGWVVQHGEVAFLGFGQRDEADGFEKPAIVEPVHPLEGCELDGLEGAPRSPSMDDLSLVEAVDRLGQRVVVGAALRAGRRRVPAWRKNRQTYKNLRGSSARNETAAELLRRAAKRVRHGGVERRGPTSVANCPCRRGESGHVPVGEILRRFRTLWPHRCQPATAPRTRIVMKRGGNLCRLPAKHELGLSRFRSYYVRLPRTMCSSGSPGRAAQSRQRARDATVA